MKHPMQNERGYSLLTTFAIMLIIITLALTLLFLTSNGLNRNTMNQQTVQANAQSDKGIDRLLAEIQKTLQEGVGEDGIPPNLFISLLEDTLNRYGCDAHPIQGESVTGKYEACIVSYEDAEDLIDGGTTPLRKEVTFRSVGSAGDIDKTVESVIELGAESIPETMKYAIGANIMSKRPSNGEGNLIIHGGAHIQGDMKVDHNIATYDRGYWYYNADRWEPSTLPTAIPTKGTRNAKLVLGNKAYSITQRPYDYEAHINRSNLGSYAKQAPLEELFEKGKAPRIVQRNPVVKPINIAEQRTNYYFNKGKELVFDNNFYEDIVISNNSQPHSDVIPFLKRKDWWGNYYYTRNADVYLFNSNHFNRLAVERHLFLREGNHQFNEGVYVGGHLLIGKETNSNNPRNYEPITLNGNIYVKGNVTITGTNLKSNTILYVEGDVKIHQTTIQGANLGNGKTGSLIIFAKGSIELSNNSWDQDQPSHIKGFFYSEDNFEMFGVRSNIIIEGGISAKRVVLNAVRGTTRNNYYESPNAQRTKPSRLQVLYDPEIIEIFSNLKKEEPIIRNLETPLVKERNEL